MKRSITCVAWTLGSASLLALAVGCSRESRPPQSPPEATSPTFESNVPPVPPPESKEQPPLPGYQKGPTGPASPPAPPPPPPGGPEEMSTPPAGPPRGAEQPSASPAATENERQLCNALASGAKLHVEDVQNGAAIVAIPRAGHDVSTIRDDAHRIESTLKQRGAGESAPTAGDACGLFAIGRLSGVTTTVNEGRGSVRIVMTTSNPAEVRDVRRIAREQVTSLKAR
jgi:hypothetical protein